MRTLLPMALAALSIAAPAAAQTISYTLSGGLAVHAPENAAREMLIDIAGQVVIGPDGEISGQGVVTYLAMAPCGWAPPHPENGVAPHCRLIRVDDGSFAITGTVLESVHRDDLDHPWHGALFDFADDYADAAPGAAPLRIELQLWPQSVPMEWMLLWGFSDGSVTTRDTGAATLGLAASGLFDAPIEIVALPAGSDAPGLGTGNLIPLAGHYPGGTPVSARGAVSLADFPYDMLPHDTDPWVWGQTWHLGQVELASAELEEIRAMMETMTQADSRDDLRGDIDAMMWEIAPPPMEGVMSPTPEFLEHIDAIRDFMLDTGSSALDAYITEYPYAPPGQTYPFDRY